MSVEQPKALLRRARNLDLNTSKVTFYLASIHVSLLKAYVIHLYTDTEIMANSMSLVSSVSIPVSQSN